MGLRNHYTGTFAVISLSALLLFMLIPDNSVADDPQAPNSHPSAPAVQKASHSEPTADVSQSPIQQVSGADVYQPPRQRLVAINPVESLPPQATRGLPEGQWVRDTPLGRVEMTVSGSKLSMSMEGTGEVTHFDPSLRGEFSVASDGTVFGLVHNLDLGASAEAAQELGDEFVLVSGLSDLPFVMRTYCDGDVMAVKQMSFALPTAMMLTNGNDYLETTVYVQSMLTGQYERVR